ncbi:MAG: hypothetical protein MMC33_010071 [Icmadophila ericetorum]|nr:hypothetical protein [Icmadophila ericetorum]
MDGPGRVPEEISLAWVVALVNNKIEATEKGAHEKIKEVIGAFKERVEELEEAFCYGWLLSYIATKDRLYPSTKEVHDECQMVIIPLLPRALGKVFISDMLAVTPGGALGATSRPERSFFRVARSLPPLIVASRDPYYTFKQRIEKFNRELQDLKNTVAAEARERHKENIPVKKLYTRVATPQIYVTSQDKVLPKKLAQTAPVLETPVPKASAPKASAPKAPVPIQASFAAVAAKGLQTSAMEGWKIVGSKKLSPAEKAKTVVDARERRLIFEREQGVEKAKEEDVMLALNEALKLHGVDRQTSIITGSKDCGQRGYQYGGNRSLARGQGARNETRKVSWSDRDVDDAEGDSVINGDNSEERPGLDPR